MWVKWDDLHFSPAKNGVVPPMCAIHRAFLFLLVFGFLASCLLAQTAKSQTEPTQETIAVFPSKMVLRGPTARHRLVVEKQRGEHFYGQAAEVHFSSDDPKVAIVDDPFVLPVGNGKATITCVWKNQKASVEVTVQDFEKPFLWSFRNHVQPVLTKAGCNSGACHGAQAGKKGFKLSLRGYDNQFDYFVLTRQARGEKNCSQ